MCSLIVSENLEPDAGMTLMNTPAGILARSTDDPGLRNCPSPEDTGSSVTRCSRRQVY